MVGGGCDSVAVGSLLLLLWLLLYLLLLSLLVLLLLLPFCCWYCCSFYVACYFPAVDVASIAGVSGGIDGATAVFVVVVSTGKVLVQSS